MHDSNTSTPDVIENRVLPIQFALLCCWAVIVIGVGGFAAGCAITEFGTLGAVSLWLVGEVAGSVAQRIVTKKSVVAGIILVAACVAVFVIAEVCWLRWTTVQGEEGWLASFQLLPAFVKEKTSAAIIGAIFCLFGAQSAFRRVARRYRIVHVADE